MIMVFCGKRRKIAQCFVNEGRTKHTCDEKFASGANFMLFSSSSFYSLFLFLSALHIHEHVSMYEYEKLSMHSILLFIGCSVRVRILKQRILMLLCTRICQSLKGIFLSLSPHYSSRDRPLLYHVWRRGKTCDAMLKTWWYAYLYRDFIHTYISPVFEV